jgi:hypothetical protein
MLWTEAGSMTTDTFTNSAAGWLPQVVAHDAWRWMDGGSAAIQACMELQLALWQPWLDAQAQWLRLWGGDMAVPSQLTRGGEQLA